MAVHRIYACVLVLGVAGLFGFGLMRSVAQTDTAPALMPEQLKPANFSSSAASNEPDVIDPVLPPAIEPLPQPMSRVEPPPLILPPVEDLKPAPKSGRPMNVAPPEIPLPPEPLAEPIKTKPEPVAPVISFPSEPKKAPTEPVKIPVEPVTPRVETLPPSLEAVKPAVPAFASGNRMSPSVSIETVAPESTAFGQPVSYEIVVKNTSSAPVTHVRVDEEIGAGTKYVSAEPAGEINGDKVLWMLGTLNAGEEKRIKVSVKPGNEGDLQTKPRVTYSVATAMHVRITRPNLVVTVTSPESSQVGDEAPLQIQISNTGTGDASKVMLKAVLTDGLKHPEGNDIQAVLNNLAPGQSQTVTLRVQAAMPGIQQCSLSAVCDGAAKASAQAKVDVRQPKLNLTLAGPAKCMVRAEPVFALEISNPGTTATEPVQLAAAFPEGLDFVTASDGGAYDAATRTVSWNLGPAAAGSKRNLTVKTKSSIAGNLAVRAVAQAGPKLNARGEAIIQADGVPALMFEVVDLEDPIEVGKETTYEIRIANTGTMHCTNVKLTAAMSDGLTVGEVTGSVPHKVVGQTLVFEPIGKLAVKKDLVIRIKAKGTMPGDQRFKVQLSCDQMKQPVVKEESTSFFQP
jgi:uncharacterized repeat protein (TIGR01451 family)